MADTEPPPSREAMDGAAVSLAVACAFFTDPQGDVLVVKPNYRDDWLFVGGLVDKGEPPHEACAREIKEEIGLDRPIGNLLVLDWERKAPFGPDPLTVYLFDGGVIDDPDQIRLQPEELEDFGFFPPERATSLAAEFNKARIGLALEARRTGTTAYQPFSRSI